MKVTTDEKTTEAIEGLRRWLMHQSGNWPGIPLHQWFDYRARIRFGVDEIWIEAESLTLAFAPKTAHTGETER